jgi:uncharacterized membrane protein YgcG
VRYAVNDDGVAGTEGTTNGENKNGYVSWFGEKNSARRVVVIGFLVFLSVTIMYWIYKGVIKQWIDHMRDVRRDRALGGRFWELEEEYQEYNRAIMASRQMADVNNRSNEDVELAGMPSELTPYTQYVVNNNAARAASVAAQPTSPSDANNNNNNNNNTINNQNPFIDSSSQSEVDGSESETSSPGGTRRGGSRNGRQRLSERARRNLMLAERVQEMDSSSPPRSLESSFRGRDGLFGS